MTRNHMAECDALYHAGMLTRPWDAAHCRSCEVFLCTIQDCEDRTREYYGIPPCKGDPLVICMCYRAGLAAAKETGD